MLQKKQEKICRMLQNNHGKICKMLQINHEKYAKSYKIIIKNMQMLFNYQAFNMQNSTK